MIDVAVTDRVDEQTFETVYPVEGHGEKRTGPVSGIPITEY
jgi:hypothetical protein